MSIKPLSGIIPIVIVTDEHYVIHLAALLKSIEVNHKSGGKIAVYVIADGVKKSSQKKIHASVSPAMFSITWVKMEDTIPAGVKLPLDRTSYPVTIYLRLFIQYIVPADTQKALFLDVDMIVLDDVSNLYNHDLGDNVIAAVQDPRLLTFDNDWGGIFNYKELGFSPDTKYFNTGLLIFDMPKWIAGNYAQAIIDCIDTNIKFANYPDQYGFNVVLANKWLELDTRWNYFASGDIEKPFLVHFISRKPFYSSYNYNPKYKELFYQYLKLTEWRNAKPIGELNRYVKKLKNIWVKVKKKF
jgi:lipopolysaccharide biosynthesis glycosyltransferase